MAEGDLSLGTAVPQIVDILDQSNGFDIVAALKLAEYAFLPTKYFGFKPLSALGLGLRRRSGCGLVARQPGTPLPRFHRFRYNFLKENLWN